MKSARETIATALFEFSGSGQGVDDMLAEIALAQSDAILSALATAGYRILAPGELDRETLERAAEVAGGNYRDHGKTFGTQRARNYEHAGKAIATAIRALAGKAGEA